MASTAGCGWPAARRYRVGNGSVHVRTGCARFRPRRVRPGRARPRRHPEFAASSLEWLSAFFLGQYADKVLAETGIEQGECLKECAVELSAGPQKRRAQHDAADALRMGLGIRQRQRCAPGAADHHPALKTEFFADHLHVGDQTRQRVVLAATLGAARPAPRWSNSTA